MRMSSDVSRPDRDRNNNNFIMLVYCFGHNTCMVSLCHTPLKMGCMLQVIFIIILILIPLGYSDSVAIEIFDVETRIQGFHSNLTITPRCVNTNIGCYGHTFINFNGGYHGNGQVISGY